MLKTAAPLEPLHTKLSEALDRIAANRNDITCQHEVNRKQVNSFFDVLHQTLDHQREVILKKLESFKNVSHKLLDLQSSDLCFLQSILSNCQEFVSSLVETSSTAEILTFKTQIADRIADLMHSIEEAQLDPVCIADSTMSCIDPSKFVTMCQSVCDVFCSPHAPNCLIDKPVRHYVNVNGKKTNSVSLSLTLKDRHGNNVVDQSEHLEAVSLEVSLPSIEQENKGIYKITYRSVSTRAHTVQIKWRGHDIVQCNIPSLLRDYTNLKVQIPEEELDPELVLNIGDIFLEGTEICSADQNNSPLTKEDELETLTQYGPNAKEFGLVAGLACGPNDEFIVADRDNDKLVLFDKDLQYSHIIGKTGENEGEFDSPHGVVCNKSGRVFVADTCNNRIQVVELDGEFVTTFGTKGSNNGEFLCPFGLVLSSTGLLFVGDTGNRRVQVFATQQDNQFQYSFCLLDYPLVTAYYLVQVALNSAEDKLFVSNLIG